MDSSGRCTPWHVPLVLFLPFHGVRVREAGRVTVLVGWKGAVRRQRVRLWKGLLLGLRVSLLVSLLCGFCVCVSLGRCSWVFLGPSQAP